MDVHLSKADVLSFGCLVILGVLIIGYGFANGFPVLILGGAVISLGTIVMAHLAHVTNRAAKDRYPDWDNP